MRDRLQRERSVLAILLFVCELAGSPRRSLADGVPGMDAATMELMSAYMAHPLRHRRALLQLGRGDLDTLPSPVLLALADARLRGGSFGPAAELCQRVLDRSPPEPLAGWAAVGKAWAEVGAGDDQHATETLADLANAGGQSALLASFLLALVEGARGDFEGARGAFQRVATSASYDRLQEAGHFGAALARYWQGDYDAALVAFDELTTRSPGSPFVDDARYGSARSRLARGDRTSAVAELQELAALPRRGVRVRFTQALLNLDPKAFLRAAVERHRRSASGLPEKQVAGALDSDGGALARRALLTLAAPDDAPSVPARLAATGDEAPVVPARPATPPTPRAQGAEPPLLALTLLAVTAVIGLALLLRWAMRRS